MVLFVGGTWWWRNYDWFGVCFVLATCFISTVVIVSGLVVNLLFWRCGTVLFGDEPDKLNEA
ncbi:hypothetical protein O9929_16740 [Vibrio lentus]|nr:hypothetical protein [Vibrio lentus]